MKPVKKFFANVDFSNIPLEEWKSKRMYAQGYRFVGSHSAIKLCEWCKKSIRGQDHCYKQDFYGIRSHQCVQMSPAVFFCDFNCQHCWRSLSFSLPPKNFRWDSPDLIFRECISQQVEFIQGFKGSKKTDLKKFQEAESPKHFAISLSGEPCLYPYLPELIEIVKSNNMTCFLVTNGAHPEMIERILSNEKYHPTNLYVTLHSPDEATYKEECCPIIRDGWKKILYSLSLLKKFPSSCKTVIRLTLNKKINMHSPEKYGALIEKSSPSFVEIKGYMAIGGARAKIGYRLMPSMEDLESFARIISDKTSYKVKDKKESSRIVLLERIRAFS